MHHAHRNWRLELHLDLPSLCLANKIFIAVLSYNYVPIPMQIKIFIVLQNMLYYQLCLLLYQAWKMH